MTQITLKGQPVHTENELIKIGSNAPDFTLTNTDLNEIKLADFKEKNIVLNIFISVDTPVCASSVRQFNQAVSGLNDTVVLCISMDLPFAQKRFCAAEGLDKVINLSAFRHPEFGKNYGIYIRDGALAGLLARCIVILDAQRKVSYVELVSEISHDPNYEAALAHLKS